MTAADIHDQTDKIERSQVLRDINEEPAHSSSIKVDRLMYVKELIDELVKEYEAIANGTPNPY